MVGEIRDPETARIAVQAALTGHLVLSTLHTNDAASAVTRLMDMGIEDYLITSTVAGVLAQRLVRVLCENCKKPAAAPAVLQQASQQSGSRKSQAMRVHEAAGCAMCSGTGYRGRHAVAELMLLNEGLRRRVLARAEAAELRAGAIEAGMVPLYQDGLQRVAEGTTSYEEVVRVAQDLS